MNSFNFINLSLLITCILCFGSTFLFVSLSLNDFTPLTSGAGRIITAGVFSLLFTFASGHRLPKTRKLWIYSSIYGTACLALPFTLVAHALESLPSSEVAIYLSSIPLFVLFLARIILKEVITQKKWLGFSIGVFGVALLTGPENILQEKMSNDLYAALLCILASILLASGGIIIQMMPKVSSISLTGSAFLVATIIMTPILVLNLPVTRVHPESILSILIVGIFCTFLGSTARFILIRRAGAVFTSINGYLAPIIASFLGIIFLSEELGLLEILSYFIIVFGVFLAQDLDKTIVQALRSIIQNKHEVE